MSLISVLSGEFHSGLHILIANECFVSSGVASVPFVPEVFCGGWILLPSLLPARGF